MVLEDIRKAYRANELYLYEFYRRFTQAVKYGKSIKQSLVRACYFRGVQILCLNLDTTWFVANEVKAINALKTYDGFRSLIEKGYIELTPYERNAKTETSL